MSVIHVLTTDGSPLGVSVRTIYGDDVQIGVGGAEYALLTMCETWHKQGHEVILYNNPREQGSPFEQRMISQFSPKEKRDILVVFRSTNAKAVISNGYKVWWSCDQFTTGMFKEFAPHMDKVVVISPFHKDYFEENYKIRNTVVTDLPVRLDDYDACEPVEKIKHRFLFSSVPDRGLHVLWRIWPMIREAIPDATLTITSDYRLWGTGAAMNERHRARWVVRDGFNFLGAVSRKQLVEEQLKSQIMVYPCTYDELFCISVSEAQVAGIYTITTDVGSLPTTNMCTVVNWNHNRGRDLYFELDERGDASFVETVKNILEREDFDANMKKIQEMARIRFSPETIAKHWEDEIFK